MGLPRYYGDSLESKVKQIDSKQPIAGADIIINTGTKFGHVGKVIGVDYGRWTITVMDSNWKDGTEAVQQRTIPINSSNIVWYNTKPAAKALA